MIFHYHEFVIFYLDPSVAGRSYASRRDIAGGGAKVRNLRRIMDCAASGAVTAVRAQIVENSVSRPSARAVPRLPDGERRSQIQDARQSSHIRFNQRNRFGRIAIWPASRD